MHKTLIGCVVLLVVFGFVAAQTDAPSDTISSRVTAVSVNVMVLDSSGFPVAGLKPSDFRVFDNGREQRITNFQESAKPMTLVAVIDSSGSTWKKINLIKDGAADFIERMARSRPQDRLAVINFNEDISVLCPFESGWREKKAMVLDNVDSQGGTALYDALWLVSRDILQKNAGRKSVILYTDGIDNKSIFNFAEARRAALAADATFHILTVDNLEQALKEARNSCYALTRKQYYSFLQQQGGEPGEPVTPRWTRNMRSQCEAKDVLETTYRNAYAELKMLAADTGGTFNKVSSYEELPVIYKKIASEMPFYYTLTFMPDSPGQEGEYHSLEVRLPDKSWEARYRRGYIVADKPGGHKRP